jgi:hypothetical protein
MVMLRRMRSARQVASMWRKIHVGFWWESQKEKETTRKT